MDTATEDERAFRLLCQEGMLFEVQDWIHSGKAVPLGGAPKESPIVVAAGKGFHSLVKLLLDHGQSQELLDGALASAAAGGHLEVCRLLLAHGGDVKAVNAAEVLRCGNPDVADLLVTAGMDVEAGFPVAKALVGHSDEALAFFRRWKRKLKTVRHQGAMALKEFVITGDDWRVTWIKRAGADVRLRVPTLYPRSKCVAWECSALEKAVLSGTFPVLLRMGVRKTDKPQKLLDLALVDMDRAKIMHLIQRGARLNDQADGGSTSLHRCLLALGGLWEGSNRGQAAWHLMREFISMGARWIPDKRMIHDVRLFLKTASPGRCVEVARLLVESKAASREAVAALFGTPAFRRRLGKDMDVIKTLLGSA